MQHAAPRRLLGTAGHEGLRAALGRAQRLALLLEHVHGLVPTEGVLDVGMQQPALGRHQQPGVVLGAEPYRGGEPAAAQQSREGEPQRPGCLEAGGGVQQRGVHQGQTAEGAALAREALQHAHHVLAEGRQRRASRGRRVGA
eukprot:scaffold59927_cov54-Phaeocystis_antarctica.AAC.3